MKKIGLLLLLAMVSFACNLGDDPENPMPKIFNILALGDSYTIGESVCDNCSFPNQLKDSLTLRFNPEDTFSLDIIAQTGWTTSDLKHAVRDANLKPKYDIVTLLIGVNNQYTSLPFETFETEFNELANAAVSLANGDKNNLIVIGIFDYANTDFGQAFGGPSITEEITTYNNFIKNYCMSNNLTYVDAQNLIFDAITNPELIASDGLHPSELAYVNLVRQLLPLANDILLE